MYEKQKHLARQLDFETLLNGLEEAKQQGSVYCRSHDDMPDLLIWNYTNKCVYDKLWTPFSMIARGLILDMKERAVVSTPFPKFFNVSESGDDNALPDMPFEVFEKLDGSLIIIFYYKGKWRASTRGALGASQALWAEAYMQKYDLSSLKIGNTYLAEAIYPENRVVIKYDEEALVLLSAYDADGFEMDADEIYRLSEAIGWRAAKRYSFEGPEELFNNVTNLPDQEEGYVLRFADGSRLKLKGLAYCRVHALISNVTPLGIWNILNAGDDIIEIRKQIPEELWDDFDAIKDAIMNKVQSRVDMVENIYDLCKDWEDKEVGLRLKEFPAETRGLIFTRRKLSSSLLEDPKAKNVLFRDARPTNNILDGYTPSFAISRVLESD